jgi:hypothetical protein
MYELQLKTSAKSILEKLGCTGMEGDVLGGRSYPGRQNLEIAQSSILCLIKA